MSQHLSGCDNMFIVVTPIDKRNMRNSEGRKIYGSLREAKVGAAKLIQKELKRREQGLNPRYTHVYIRKYDPKYGYGFVGYVDVGTKVVKGVKKQFHEDIWMYNSAGHKESVRFSPRTGENYKYSINPNIVSVYNRTKAKKKNEEYGIKGKLRPFGL